LGLVEVLWRLERHSCQKSRSVLRETFKVKHVFMGRHKSVLPVYWGLAPAGATSVGRGRRQVEVCPAVASRDALMAHLEVIHVQFKHENGWQRVWKELLVNGVQVCKERVRRLLAQHGIKTYIKRKPKLRPT
jgi:putative transposase